MNVILLQAARAALFLVSTGALAAEVTIICTLDDNRSQKFCSQSTLRASACQRTYALNEEKQTIKELNAGQILPTFYTRSWSPTTISATRTIRTPGDRVNQVMTTYLDRISGRLIQSSTYVDDLTKQPLTGAALNSFETEQVDKWGALFGRLDRDPITGICKAIERAF